MLAVSPAANEESYAKGWFIHDRPYSPRFGTGLEGKNFTGYGHVGQVSGHSVLDRGDDGLQVAVTASTRPKVEMDFEMDVVTLTKAIQERLENGRWPDHDLF